MDACARARWGLCDHPQNTIEHSGVIWQRPVRVCAVTRRRFPVGASPTRRPLQPEAAGAAKEVTNWLKPSECVSRIGDSASVQAVMRVNAEQASKRTMRRPTRRPECTIFSAAVPKADIRSFRSARCFVPIAAIEAKRLHQNGAVRRTGLHKPRRK